MDVACSYLSFNGFFVDFLSDGVNEVYVYPYQGTSNASDPLIGELGNWACILPTSRSSSGFELAAPNFDYKTFRSFNNTESEICAYELVIFSPRGTSFSYTVYTDYAL